jgi:hypothetical protein
MFNRNEGPGIRRNLGAIDSVVDEVLIVDSSDPEEFERLNSDLSSAKVRVVRALPLGCTEPLRPWAFRQIASEQVLSLDSDEEASPELLRAVPTLRSADGYFLPRWEQKIDAYSFQLRLHRREALTYRGTIHESPVALGGTEQLSLPIRIVHHADYRNYLGKTPRGDGYLLIEAYERPFSAEHLREEYPGRIGRTILGHGGGSISPLRAAMIAASHRWRRYNRLNGLRGNYLTGKYLAGYVRARYRFFRSLSESERQLATTISREIATAGGVVKYLGFDRPGYIERMTESFPWDRSGSRALVELLRFRHQHGTPMPKWGALPPPDVGSP